MQKQYLYTYTFKTYFFNLCLCWSKRFQVSLVQDWPVWTLWWEHSLCLFVNILKLCPHFAQLALSSSKPERLSGENLSVSNPRLSPDGSTLIYLQGAVFGPHNQCLSLQQVLYVCSCVWGFCACLCVLSLNGWLRTDSWIILHSWIWKAGRHLRCWMLSAGHRLVRYSSWRCQKRGSCQFQLEFCNCDGWVFQNSDLKNYKFSQ